MIHIYQRHCNVSSNSVGKSRPEWFSREGCFQNLLKTTSKHKNIKITIMFDGEPNKDHFINKYNSDFYELVKREGGDDARSFLNVVNYVAEQNLPEDEPDLIFLGAISQARAPHVALAGRSNHFLISTTGRRALLRGAASLVPRNVPP